MYLEKNQYVLQFVTEEEQRRRNGRLAAAGGWVVGRVESRARGCVAAGTRDIGANGLHPDAASACGRLIAFALRLRAQAQPGICEYTRGTRTGGARCSTVAAGKKKDTTTASGSQERAVNWLMRVDSVIFFVENHEMRLKAGVRQVHGCNKGH